MKLTKLILVGSNLLMKDPLAISISLLKLKRFEVFHQENFKNANGRGMLSIIVIYLIHCTLYNVSIW